MKFGSGLVANPSPGWIFTNWLICASLGAPPEYLKRKQLTREHYFEREQKIAEHRKELCTNPNCSIVILPGIAHGDFGDGILLKWPLRSWNDVDSYKTIAIINETVLRFLDKYLE
jgi:hypothetical protein